MVDRAPTRSSSRRATDTPEPAQVSGQRASSEGLPRRSTRATRSQSRHLGESDATTSTLRGRKRRAEAHAKGGKEKLVDPPREHQDLSTVKEEFNITYPDLGPGQDDIARQAAGDDESLRERLLQSPKPPGRLSMFSGTTARNSRSGQELIDLSPETMLDALPGLSANSDKLLGHSVPSDISEERIAAMATELRAKNSRMTKVFRRLGRLLKVEREAFGSESFIDTAIIMATLLSTQDVPQFANEPWRPDPVFHKINLATWSSDLLESQGGIDRPHFWEELDEKFPRLFVDSFEAMPTGFFEETMQLAIEIRTQHALMYLLRFRSEQNFDFDSILHQIYYQDGGLKGWDVEGLRSTQLPKQIREQLLERLEYIRGVCGKQTEAAENHIRIVEEARQAFPWTHFARLAMKWINECLAKAQDMINAGGGTEAIVRSLNDEIQKRNEVSPPVEDKPSAIAGEPQVVLDYDPPSEPPLPIPGDTKKPTETRPRAKRFSSGPFSAHSNKAKLAVAHLKRREAGRSPSLTDRNQPEIQLASIAQLAVTAGPSSRTLVPQRKAGNQERLSPTLAPISTIDQMEDSDDGWRNNGEEDAIFQNDNVGEDNDYLHKAEDVNAIINRTVASDAKNQAESNKENRGSAERISTLQPARTKRRINDHQANAEKVRFSSGESDSGNGHGQDSDESSEIAYQTQREPPAKKRFPPKAAATITASPKRARIAQDDPARVPLRPALVVRDEPEREPQRSQVGTYYLANSSAKDIVAMQKSKKVQKRKAWSVEEIETLHDLITHHGTSYALLKSIDRSRDDILEARDQVSLKDKARNMKFDYLKASGRLPPNFELIPINKDQIRRLEDIGIEYDPETGYRRDRIRDE